MLRKFELCSIKKPAYLCYISNLLIIRYVLTKDYGLYLVKETSFVGWAPHRTVANGSRR